jgi:hypothetical protein
LFCCNETVMAQVFADPLFVHVPSSRESERKYQLTCNKEEVEFLIR